MKLRLDEIAIFVLGTTNHIHKRSLYDSRLTPIVDTYGQFFRHLYFVFGTNLFDHKFLRSSCTPKHAAASGGRRLRAHTRQTPPEDRVTEYLCPVATTNITDTAALGLPHRSTANILWVGNCTGEYFGIGPTCRCQESMRYYLGSADPSLRSTRWFIFMGKPPLAILCCPPSRLCHPHYRRPTRPPDDDLYIRPYSLLALLDHFPRRTAPGGRVLRSDTVALVSDSDNFGFAFSTRWSPDIHKVSLSTSLSASLPHPPITESDDVCLSACHLSVSARQCMAEPAVHAFAYAQPAILSRDTVRFMRSALDANGLTGLQGLWGGTHDALLGLLLFAFDVNIYSLRNSYDTQYFYKVDRLRRLH